MSGFANNTLSAENTQLCPCSVKEQPQCGHNWVCLCANKTLFIRIGGSWIWPVGHSLSTPILD